MKYRCTGTLHGSPGDCLRPIAGALLCYGYLDLERSVPLEDSLSEPLAMLFPACSVHRIPLVDWAEHLWGRIADGTWLPPESIPAALAFMRSDHEPVTISPDPSHAVGIFVS